MAKMFYTLEEAAEQLGIDPDQVRQMATDGKLQQFRDRDKLMFKREQVDNLAKEAGASGASAAPHQPADSGDTDQIQLGGGTEAGIELESSQAGDSAGGTGGREGTGTGSSQQGQSADPASLDVDTDTGEKKEDPRQATGISVFDASEVEGADPMAQTQMTEGVDDEELALDSVGSGSGLLDLTRESDDTSLGAELLDEIYPPGDTSAGGTGVGASSSGVFEGVLPGDTASGAAGIEEVEAGQGAGFEHQAIAAEAEPYDPAGSFMAFGFMLGAFAALLLVMIVGLAQFMGVPIQLTATLAGEPDAPSLMIYTLAIAGLSIVAGVIGYFVGKAQAPS